MQKLYDDLKEKFEVSDLKEQRQDLHFMTVEKKHLIPLLTYLRDLQNYTSLIFLQSVDHIEMGIFQLTYMLHNYVENQSLGIRVMLSREAAVMDSIHHLWEHAETFQRELKELFGIDFPGSPGLDDGFVLEGWDNIPPMRKDFDTVKYSQETFFPRPGRSTEDPAEYMKKKLYPEKKGE
jgi:NADH-quinone oxidoreductase subunit C